MPSTPLRLADERTPPTLLFAPPADRDGPLPLILFGHGAHLSKDDPIMQMIAKGFGRGVGAAVALMDAPGHGERRAAATDEQFDADVARRMSDPANHARLAEDWRAVDAAARAADPRITGPTGYAGFSMGALFGLSIVANLPEVTAAVFALGGLQRNPQRDELIRSGVSRLGAREVLMLNMTRDEHFPIDGALEVLELVPGPKRMAVWTGTHADLPPEAVQLAVDFFRRTLVP